MHNFEASRKRYILDNAKNAFVYSLFWTEISGQIIVEIQKKIGYRLNPTNASHSIT